MRESDDIATLRQQLVPLTRQLEMRWLGFGAGQTKKLYRAHCPMAFSNREPTGCKRPGVIANPYFGSAFRAAMFRHNAGEITGET
jgi:hypothetical protein